MTDEDLRRREALVELVSRPDPPDIAGKRGFRLILEGRPERLAQLPNLALAYIGYRWSLRGVE